MENTLNQLTQNVCDHSKLAYANLKRGFKDNTAYHEGAAYGYHKSREIIEKELHELKLKFQNGYLTLSDFGV